MVVSVTGVADPLCKKSCRKFDAIVDVSGRVWKPSEAGAVEPTRLWFLHRVTIDSTATLLQSHLSMKDHLTGGLPATSDCPA